MRTLNRSSLLALCFLLPSVSCFAPTESGLSADETGEFTVALSRWQPEAEAGDQRAQFVLGLAYEYGEGVDLDLAQAAHWYELSAQQGFPPAETNLGLLFYEGRGREQSFEEAATWFERAAESGFAAAQTNLGVMHLLGQSMPRDTERARALFELAAEQGDESARDLLDRLPSQGADGLLQLVEAAEDHRRSTKQGAGQAQPRGDQLALTWLERAAREGSVEAQVALGLLLRYGIGTEQDSAAALVWLTLAAEQNSAAAQCELGLMHLAGEGAPLDDQAAAQWLQCSAEQGNPVAQHNLGLLYAKGRGVDRDFCSARDWLERAAASGLAESHYKLGCLNENASIVEGDPVTAYFHHLVAEELGQNSASSHRMLLEERLHQSQRSEGRSRAERWLDEH